MAAGDTCIVDPVDTVHHEKDSAARSHCVYKSVCMVISNTRTTHFREGACQPIHMIDLQYVYWGTICDRGWNKKASTVIYR